MFPVNDMNLYDADIGAHSGVSKSRRSPPPPNKISAHEFLFSPYGGGGLFPLFSLQKFLRAPMNADEMYI